MSLLFLTFRMLQCNSYNTIYKHLIYYIPYTNFITYFNFTMVNEDNNYFVREISVKGDTLKLYQKLEGDVNCIVWDASIVLAKYLEKSDYKKHGYLKEQKIVELGAGVGCSGLMAAYLGAEVVLTDLEEAMPIIKRNISENEHLFNTNGGKVTATVLKWGQETTIKKPNIILLADCIYYKDSINPLIETLKNLSSTNVEIIQAQEMRDSEIQRSHWSYYFERLQEIFTVNEVPLNDQDDEYSSADIKIYKIWLKY